MILKEFKVLGHTLKYLVTSDSAEFNKLDTTRADAANDEAVLNIVYRSMNPTTRSWFLHGRDAEAAKDGKPAVTEIVGVEATLEKMFEDVVYDAADQEANRTISRKTIVAKNAKGETRMKDGVEVTTFDESQEKFYDRAIAMAVKYKKFASEDAARAHFQPLIEQIANEVVFNPKAEPAAERGPKKLAARYKLAAAKALATGTWGRVNEKVLVQIQKSFSPTNDSTKMFTGKYPSKDHKGEDIAVDFSVSDKDAEALGWLLKEFQDWKSQQELVALTD